MQPNTIWNAESCLAKFQNHKPSGAFHQILIGQRFQSSKLIPSKLIPKQIDPKKGLIQSTSDRFPLSTFRIKQKAYLLFSDLPFSLEAQFFGRAVLRVAGQSAVNLFLYSTLQPFTNAQKTRINTLDSIIYVQLHQPSSTQNNQKKLPDPFCRHCRQ